ncbi:XRE family transcriptional regulator [Yinghuangia aomiensis]|uniref:XRE family transcriptional regulator n=1 Tax=Yinghuangia aomiensis TaxID=676205 RepID=UPI0031EE41A6
MTSFEKIAQIADALRIPGQLVGLANRPWELVQSVPKPAADQDGPEAVKRREFIRTSLASLGVTAAAVPFMPVDAGPRVGSSFTRQLVDRTARLRQLDNYLGGLDTYRVYLAEVETTLSVLKHSSYDGVTERALLSILAEQDQQAGWAAFDAGYHERSDAHYRSSLAAAQQAGDLPLAANALIFTSYQLVSTQHTGSEAAAVACGMIPPDAPHTVRALLHERLAWAYAVEGNGCECERALAVAEDAINRPDPQSQPDWSAWVDRDEVSIMAGRCWAELRRPLRAVHALEGALDRFQDTHARDKALYLTWLADAYIDACEIDEAVATVDRAMELSQGVGSTRPHQRAKAVMTRLAPYQDVPQVAALLERAKS